MLAAMTLVPVSTSRTPLTPDDLYDLLVGLRTEGDPIEHIKVIEAAGRLRIGAYVSVAETAQAQECLERLCIRLASAIFGWEIVVGI
jgi:hypothetical protein